MEVQSGVKRAAMTATITRLDGTTEERVYAFASADPAEHRRVNDALARGDHFTETELIPHGAMAPLED